MTVAASTRQQELERLALALSDRPELRETREAALDVFQTHPNAATPDGRRSLHDAATQHFYGAIQLATNSDPAHPHVLTTCLYEHPIADGEAFPAALHGGLENPDNVYRIVPVGADWRYELTGVRHANPPAQVTYELMDSAPGVDGIGEQLGLVTDGELHTDADGRFTITIDADPADGRPNHIHCPPGAKALFIRDTLSDWHTQQPHRLRITRVGGPDRPLRSEDDIVREAAGLVPRYAQFWNDFRDRFLAGSDRETNGFGPPLARTGGWGYIVNTPYLLARDEALVFTTDRGAAPYHAVLVGNDWWIAHDASRRSGAYNQSQTRDNRDGSTTFVVAAQDPGVANWLDTGGLHSGIVQVRWQGAGADAAPPRPVRDVQVVGVRELSELLPPLSPELRQAELTARHTSYLRRLDYL